jgi:hypothetical protein
MSLFGIGFLGSTPIGAPLIGLICMASSPRFGLALGGVATMLATVPLLLSARKTQPDKRLDLAL